MYHDTDREERSSMIEMMEAEYDSLSEMTEAEYGVLGEAAAAEYGICDLLDENIPSPLEMDNAGETLVLPEIQDMTEYIRRHYEQEIMKKLAWRLRWEELCVVSDGKYYQDLPWTGSEDYGEEVSLPDPEDIIPKDFDDPRFADEKTRYATLPPIRLNNHLRHVTRPANRICAGSQRWKIPAHVAVHADFAVVGFHERRVQRDAVGDSVQFNNAHVHHEGDFSGAIHRDDRFGIDAAGVGDERAGGRHGDRRHIFLIPEGLAAEVHRKRPVWISPQNLFKRDLIHDPGKIKAARPVGEGDFPASL